MTSVDPHWLAELGPAFYGIQEKGARSSSKSETASEFNAKTELEMRMAEDRMRQAQERLGALFTDEERRRFRVRTALRLGSPFVEIIRYARDEHADLIVMGTHGRGAIAHMLLGSVAERVVRKAACPVLTVRHAAHDFELP